MEVEYPTINEPATPEYVLAVIRDMHRQQCQYDVEADPDIALTMETTVSEWRSACDLLSTRELGHALNRIWDLSGTDAEWRDVLESESTQRLTDVCRFIASRVTRPRIRPSRLLGGDCTPAGVFLTIRALLHGAGDSARNIAPSTLLADYTRRYSDVFLGPVSRLAPGALPPVRIRHPVYDLAVSLLSLSILSILVGACTARLIVVVAGLLLCLVCYALVWVAARYLLPLSVTFGELRTFRDLAIVIAGHHDVNLGAESANE